MQGSGSFLDGESFLFPNLQRRDENDKPVNEAGFAQVIYSFSLFLSPISSDDFLYLGSACVNARMMLNMVDVSHSDWDSALST